MPTFFSISHLSFDARSLARPEESHVLSQADLFDPKKNKGESFLHWCVGSHGGASAAGGRQAIYCGHARGQAVRLLVSWHAKPAALRMEKVSAHQPGTFCMQVSTQGKGGRNARKEQQHLQAINNGAALRLSRSARPTQDTDPPAGYKSRRSASPNEETNDIWRAHMIHWVTRLPAFTLFLWFPISSLPSPQVHGIGHQVLCSHAVPWPRSLRTLGTQSFEGSPRTSGYHGRLQSKSRTRDGGLRRLGSNFCGPSILTLHDLLFLSSFVSNSFSTTVFRWIFSPPHRSHLLVAHDALREGSSFPADT